MTNKRRTVGTDAHRFPVGGMKDKGNAGTRKTVSGVLREAGFTKEMIERKVADILLMNRPETAKMKEDLETSNFDLIIVSVVEAAQRNADCSRMDNLLEKIFGKTVQIKGSVSIENKGEFPANVTYGDAELVQRAIERALMNVAAE